MKNIYCTIILLLITFSSYAQKDTTRKWYGVTQNEKKFIFPAQFIAGMADGVNQVLTHHIHTFEKKFPNANMNWWNPILSQHNKDHTLTVISDGFHTTRLIEHSMNYFSIGISMIDLTKYKKKQWPLVIAKKMFYSMLVNRIGFDIVYNRFFHVKNSTP